MRRIPSGNGHAILRPAEQPDPSTRTLAPVRLGLTQLDKLAASTFASGDVAQMLEQVRARAEVLVGADRDGARLRMLSKRLATCEAQAEILEALIGTALARRDFEAVRELDALLRTFTSRLVLLAREHAQEGSLGRRSLVVARRTEVAAVREE